MSTKLTKQPSIERLFRQLIEKNKVQHAYLFEGKAGTGKKESALWVAQALFCQESDDKPCGQCSACHRIATHQHPDVVEVVPDGQSIKINQVRELKQAFSKSGMESRKKVVIVEDVEKMTNQAANSLLKFLEEPDGDISVFLTTTAKNRLLPTILSRCQLVHFPELSKEKQMATLTEEGLKKEQAALLSHVTNDTQEAKTLAEDDDFQEVIQFIWKWYTMLSKVDDQAFIFVHTDIMSKAKDKNQSILMLDLLLILFQDLLNLKVSAEYSLAYLEKKNKIENDSKRFSTLTIANVMDTILTAKKQLESNVAAQGVFENCTLQMLGYLKNERHGFS